MRAPAPFANIRYEVDDHVATITLDRPDRLNAMTDDVYDDLHAALDLIDADDDVRAVVITGAGRGFCAGRDLSGGGSTFTYEAGAAHRGIGGEAASTWFLPRVVGISRALEWSTTGRVFDAEEARAGGLVRSVHEPE